jgi:hypothetical protein
VLRLALAGRPVGGWLPSLAGIVLAGLVFATAWVGPRHERVDRGGGASIVPEAP